MENLLSLLIPVHNAQGTLSADIDQLLTIAMELTPWPDLVVIDNGSTDATIEIACEIAIGYPQVRCLRQQQRCSLRRIVETGLKRARGQYVFVRTGTGPLDVTELARCGLQVHAGPLLATLRGLDAQGVRAVLVAVLCERASPRQDVR